MLPIAPSWFDIVGGVIFVANVYVMLIVKQAVTQLKLDMAEKYLTKQDFKDWSRRAPNVPNYTEDDTYEKTIRRVM